MKPSLGRIVLYKLSVNDLSEIARIRMLGGAARGNVPLVGEEVPLIVTSVKEPRLAADLPRRLNGQVILDGNDSLWVTSVPEGDEPGTWHWPERIYEDAPDKGYSPARRK